MTHFNHRNMTERNAPVTRDPPQEVVMAARFLPLTEVAEILSISAAQAYALVRSGELPAIKVGGRGQWRVEVAQLEDYIQRMYAETRAHVATGSHTVEAAVDAHH